MVLRCVLAWIPMPFIGIINGILREYGYKDLVGDPLAHQISTLTGILFFGVYVWFLTRKWRLESGVEAVAVGFIWLGLTVAFEFFFGYFVMKNPWSVLLHDYNVLEGRLWPLVLIWIAVSPMLFYKLRSKK